MLVPQAPAAASHSSVVVLSAVVAPQPEGSAGSPMHTPLEKTALVEQASAATTQAPLESAVPGDAQLLGRAGSRTQTPFEKVVPELQAVDATSHWELDRAVLAPHAEILALHTGTAESHTLVAAGHTLALLMVHFLMTGSHEVPGPQFRYAVCNQMICAERFVLMV